MDNQSQDPTLDLPRHLHETQFPRGVIKPWMLAATPTMAKGDLYYSNGSIFVQLLASTVPNQVLTLVGGVPTWQSQPAAVFPLPRSLAASVGFGATKYMDTGGILQSSETGAGDIMPLAGNLKNLYIDCFTNTLNSGNIVYTLYKNGIATSLVVTVAFGVTSITGDTTHSVTVAAGDRITLQAVAGGTGGGVTAGFSYEFYQ